ncbi:MAG TPA: hypothetical protein VN673_02520 [Clostridia bacterium]|nr:hypothetical protein [Clostridia bacterium]
MNSPVQSTLRIAQLIDLLQTVKGRKKLQKLVHILQELGHPFPEPFEYSFYGMYSQQLRSELDVLVAEDFISESPLAGGTGYEFKANPRLRRLLEGLGVGSQPPWGDLAQELNKRRPQELEAISTILVLRRRGLVGPELKRKVLELKPHLRSIFDSSLAEAEALAA